MILSKRVALGGVQLDELHERIVIRSVDPGVPKETVTAASRMGGVGQRMTSQHWDTLEVSVGFAIDVPKTAMALRRQIFDTVMTWAMRKGWLTVNWMTDRRLYVDKVVLPDGGDMFEWTNEYTLVFRAYNVPFWTDVTPSQVSSGTVSSGSVSAQVGGNVRSVLDVSFRNRSGMTINNFWVQANGNRITLKGLGLGGSSTLTINHGTDGLLRITIGSTNVYSRYTGADDLYVDPGKVTVSFSADRAGTLTVQNYGRWV